MKPFEDAYGVVQNLVEVRPQIVEGRSSMWTNTLVHLWQLLQGQEMTADLL